MADEKDDKNQGGGGADDKDKQNQNPDPNKQDDKGGDDSDKKVPETVPYGEFQKSREALREANKKLTELQEAQKKADDEKMKENQQFKELAEKRENELSETKSKYETSLKKVRFAELAIKEGVVNVDDAFRLADLEGVSMSDDGSVSGMEDVVAKLKESKQYLFGSQDQSLGGGSNPPKDGDTQGGKRVYRQSQIEDPEFYKANEADIKKAYVEGRVING